MRRAAAVVALALALAPAARADVLTPVWAYAHRTVNLEASLPLRVSSAVWWPLPAGQASLAWDRPAGRLLLSCHGPLVFRVGQSAPGERLFRTLDCEARRSGSVRLLVGGTIWPEVWGIGARPPVGWPPE